MTYLDTCIGIYALEGADADAADVHAAFGEHQNEEFAISPARGDGMPGGPHLAIALTSGCSAFWTSDHSLAGAVGDFTPVIPRQP